MLAQNKWTKAIVNVSAAQQAMKQAAATVKLQALMRGFIRRKQQEKFLRQYEGGHAKLPPGRLTARSRMGSRTGTVAHAPPTAVDRAPLRAHVSRTGRDLRPEALEDRRCARR